MTQSPPEAEPADLFQFDYRLPNELIAQHPLPNRSDSRLMFVDRTRGSIEHHHFRDLPGLLREGDALVVNDTRVVPAKLVGYRKDTGGRWQGLWLQSDAQPHVIRFLCKTRSRLRPSEVITLLDRHGRDFCDLVLLARLGDGSWAGRLMSDSPPDEVLRQIGRVPLPHYIRGGNMVDADVADYQTVFAKHPGSVAAPTAGLHLTQSLLRQLVDRGIEVCPVTLHVGIGTFRPISVPRISEHAMHAERGELRADGAARLNRVRSAGGRIVAVGTTSVRVLESAVDKAGHLVAWSGETTLFIRPGHTFRAVDALVTNFHLPRSTLLVLVYAFGGSELIRRAYEAAVAEKYRFFSYGDAMLIV
jgi:S-adenosylmethionine:tRNA ribosyltransferase-isomerase